MVDLNEKLRLDVSDTATQLRGRVERADLVTDLGLSRALRLLAKWRARVLQAEIWTRNGGRIAGGPFAGMKYFAGGTEGGVAPRLLGIYESELHLFVEQFISKSPKNIVVIGCAEGYYAVGFPYRLADAVVHAFDIDPRAQNACRALAAMNGVAHRVAVGAAFAPQILQGMEGGTTLLLCDAEGAEAELIDPVGCPALRSVSALIVECHEAKRPGVTDRIKDAFAPTHRVQFVPHAFSAPPMPEFLRQRSHLDQLLSLWDWRPGPTPWLVMTRD